MAYRWELDDELWEEVVTINSYALFVGYLSMAIKGLGFLILTWTTVVLLGGFVSMLQKKDFWCLTFITLVQTTGIFDVYQNEKLSYKYIKDSAVGLAGGVLVGCDADTTDDVARSFLACVSLMIQMLVLAILLCPLAATYIFGLLISMGISIWRLVQHDYGSNSDGGENLKPAMDTLYYLALLQGVLFCYRFLFSRMRKALAKTTVIDYDNELEVVLTYLREIRIGCEKDPSFARGRNLITHAVDLIGSKSREECLSGVKMLYTAICMGERKLKKASGKSDIIKRWKEIIGQNMMMKNMIIPASSSPVLQKLLQTLDPRGAFDRETRNQGATIVLHLALDIHLEQVPGAIQYICTLISSFEEYRLIEPHHRDRLLLKHTRSWWNAHTRRLWSPGNDASNLREAYEKLVLTGLCILWKLATHENNCRIISQTQGLLPRIMAPLTSDIIHQFNGGTWSISVVEGSLKVMSLLAAVPGETGSKLRREISSNKEAVGTMERILNCECDCCSAKLQKRAMRILIQLYMDTKSRETYIKMLVDIFANDKKDWSIRNLAGEALAKLSIQGRSNTSIILHVNGDVVGRLTRILLLDDAENKTCRIRAAEILEQMCIHHTKYDEPVSKLKKNMTDIMPEVLAQILSRGQAKDKTHLRTEEDQVVVTEKKVDIENQYDEKKISQGKTQLLHRGDAYGHFIKKDPSIQPLLQYDENSRDKPSSSTRPQNNQHQGEVKAEVQVEMDMEVDELDNEEDEEFHAPLLSLFVTVRDTFISADQDLTSQFGEVDAISLPKKLKEMVADNSIATAPCLRLLKLTCKMVISMMKHRGSYIKEDLESLTEALSSASKTMSVLDVSMVFAREDDAAATAMKPIRSLGSLVKEAKESVATCFKAQEQGNIEPLTST